MLGSKARPSRVGSWACVDLAPERSLDLAGSTGIHQVFAPTVVYDVIFAVLYRIGIKEWDQGSMVGFFNPGFNSIEHISLYLNALVSLGRMV